MTVSTGRIDECRVVRVIRVTFLRGDGTAADPARIVTAYYTLDGEIIAERDTWAEQRAAKSAAAVALETAEHILGLLQIGDPMPVLSAKIAAVLRDDVKPWIAKRYGAGT